ncbi:cytochrome P450 [Cristinia sonorae]|uniref:Cytochrome P450 n=1 Tax=Cristinia sonorae TaxID=1940300 RepID=A0A8K0UV39_9AGAR|nr:cytochrome P450 [Cristinia sonorae]
MSLVSLVTLALVLVAALLYKNRSYHARRLPLPPGPRRRWLIGNLLDFPTSRPCITFRDWCREYGGLVFVDIPFKPVLIIGSFQVAKDLLDARSNIYSDRPYFAMMDLANWGWAFSMMAYTPSFRAHRRLFIEHFNRTAMQKYRSIQLQETHAVLVRLLHTPDMARQHLRTLPASTIMRIVYGARNASQMNEYIDIAEQAMDAVRKLLVPGAFLAEFIPFLRHFPPGCRYRPIVQRLRDQPFEEVQRTMAEGKAMPSVAYSLIRQLQGENENLTAEQDYLARGVAGGAYGAASDTTTAVTEVFVVAMAMYPDVQRKAQAELDRIVGPSRLPDFGDLESLVYIRAIMLESLRWIPTIPTCVPHAVSVDDVYEGYFIPKGTLVIPNIWAMLHNPEDYPGPETFKPERFINKEGKIDPSVRDPTTIAFGFGRRMCAGLDFAATTLHILLASMLHVYDMKPGVDERGQPVILSGEGSDEAISYVPYFFPGESRRK